MGFFVSGMMVQFPLQIHWIINILYIIVILRDNMILEAFFSIALFINGGHVIDTKLGLHHYSDEDYKEILFLESKDSITKNCTRHSKIEDVKKSYIIDPMKMVEKWLQDIKYIILIPIKILPNKILLIVKEENNK